MGWLLRVAVRLAPLRKLKARRRGLLLEKQPLLAEEKRLRCKLFEAGDGMLLAKNCDQQQRLNRQLDAINAEIGRRGDR